MWASFRFALIHLGVLIKKNFKIFFRDRTLLILTILTPIISVFIYSISAQNSTSTVQYNVAFVNYDAQNVEDPILNLTSTVSMLLVGITKNLTFVQNNLTIPQFNVIDTYQGNLINESIGKKLCDDGKIDALIIIPENFSEIIIGNTFWYRELKANNFTDLDEMLQVANLSVSISQEYKKNLQGSNFPTNETPTLDFYSNPSPIKGGVARSIIEGILNQLIIVINGENVPDISNINSGGIGSKNLTYFEINLPLYMVLITLFPIASVSILILKEKETNTLQLIESTFTRNITHMSSIGITQLCLSIFQVGLTIFLFNALGYYLNPLGDLGCLIFVLAFLSIISTNIGLIIGNLSRSFSVAISFAVLLILILELLGGTFFGIDPILGQYFLTYYANQISTFIIIQGKGWIFLLPYLWTLVLFYVITFILALISMRLRQQFKGI
jgi:ABC-type Na+ efflux pump permease subunit